MTEIYLVVLNTGGWDDYWQEPVAAFCDEQAAKDHCDQLNGEEPSNIKIWNKINRVHSDVVAELKKRVDKSIPDHWTTLLNDFDTLVDARRREILTSLGIAEDRHDWLIDNLRTHEGTYDVTSVPLLQGTLTNE